MLVRIGARRCFVALEQMTDELPTFSPIELACGERMGKLAAPQIKDGKPLEEALTAAYPNESQHAGFPHVKVQL
ncbi:MAG: hypothetical protein ABS76_28305 [Pelagibacterium sp. SCN 64-44]|nr:MAG: hypothetical protein ABS76_28305 [Pelagibacterium sp. SCN 64-44]